MAPHNREVHTQKNAAGTPTSQNYKTHKAFFLQGFHLYMRLVRSLVRNISLFLGDFVKLYSTYFGYFCFLGDLY